MRNASHPRWIPVGLWILVILAVAGLYAGLVFAAPPAQPADTKIAHVSAEHLVSITQDGNTKVTTLSKATIKHEDAVFTADSVVMRSQGDVHEFTCTGNPVFTDPENRITGDKAIAQSTPRRAEFIGNVKMVSTPKKKTGESSDTKKELTGEPSTTTCDALTYDYSHKIGQAKGNVIIRQKLRTVWADQATYDQNKELVELTGNVRMKNTGEEEVKELKNAQTVTVSLENDWIDIVAKPGETIDIDIAVKDEEQGNGNKENK